jgi:hypothetical protein
MPGVGQEGKRVGQQAAGELDQENQKGQGQRGLQSRAPIG